MDSISQAVVDSSKLLKQLQEEAIKNIKSVVYQNNSNTLMFSAFVMSDKRYVGLANGKWSIHFILNNIEVEVEGDYDPSGDPKKIVGKIYSAIQDEVIKRMIDTMSPEIEKILNIK